MSGEYTDSDHAILRLWGVEFKVRPTPEHPTYYEWQFGVLLVVVLAKDTRSATDTVSKILEHLPYEVLDPVSRGINANELSAEREIAAREAKQLGIGFWLGERPTGSDESELETLPW